MAHNILLLEDLPEIRAWMKALVTRVFPKSRIHEAALVQDALGLTASIKFDLALLDLGLPDGSGVEVVEALRDRQPEVQSVVVTIHDDDDHLFPALQAGAFGYLLKDQPRELIADQLRRMSAGEHVIVTTPTASGKTGAFFPAVFERLERDWLPKAASTRCTSSTQKWNT
jgi:DNA-binding NarL/FixJ family response regulator